MNNTQRVRNKEIRELIAKRGLKHYEVASALGINQFTFSHWLQLELPQEKQAEIIRVIRGIEL